MGREEGKIARARFNLIPIFSHPKKHLNSDWVRVCSNGIIGGPFGMRLGVDFFQLCSEIGHGLVLFGPDSRKNFKQRFACSLGV